MYYFWRESKEEGLPISARICFIPSRSNSSIKGCQRLEFLVVALGDAQGERGQLGFFNHVITSFVFVRSDLCSIHLQMY
jgi:hypothetical protein